MTDAPAYACCELPVDQQGTLSRAARLREEFDTREMADNGREC